MPTPEEATITKMLEDFMSDRKDADFARVVKEFLSRSPEDRFNAFLFTLASAKIFANVILDGGELTTSNAVLMQTVEIQMAKLLEEQRTQEESELSSGF